MPKPRPSWASRWAPSRRAFVRGSPNYATGWKVRHEPLGQDETGRGPLRTERGDPCLCAGRYPESELAAIEAHIESCPDCRRELQGLRPLVKRFVSWPADLLSPAASLRERLAKRIAADSGTAMKPPSRTWVEPEWE